MQSQISEISSVLFEVSVEVPWDHVAKALDDSYLQLGRTAKLRGFRPGKVPRSVLKQYFSENVSKDVVRNLVQAGLGQAFATHNLSVIADPVLETAPVIKQGESLAFKAKIEVSPKIDHVDTDGLMLTRGSSAVSEPELDSAIEELRQNNAVLSVPAEMRPAMETDVLICDYSVAVEGTPRPELSAEARPIDLGASLVPELRAALTGRQPGEKLSVVVTFPAAGGGEFAGKQGTFEIEVKELKERVLPAPDDEFAKDLNFASFDALRAATRERLEAAASERVEHDLRDQLINQLIEKNPIEVPPSLVSRQRQALLQEYLRAIRSGVQLPPEAMEEAKAESERRVRAGLLLNAVAVTRSIRIEPQDLDAHFEEVANRTGKHIAKARAEVQGEQRQMLQSQILEEKLLEYLLAQATISDGQPE